MIWRETYGLMIAIALGVFLTVLGVPDAPISHEMNGHSSETHAHGGEGSTPASGGDHCHPGLDCSVAAFFVLAHRQSYEPIFSAGERHFSEIHRPNIHANLDPPPPRGVV
jgi:hypothetical protein